jgi:hypothetical protein
MFGMTNCQHRARRRPHDFLRDAAHENLRQPAAPLRAHDDQSISRASAYFTMASAG